jgi:hypothetical protein
VTGGGEWQRVHAITTTNVQDPESCPESRRHSFTGGEVLAQLRRQVARVSSALGETVVTARDACGPIPIEPAHDERHWCWLGRRATTGPVTLEYHVTLRRVDALTTDGGGWYADVATPGLTGYRRKLKFDVDYNHGMGVSTVEFANQTHYNGHPNKKIGHWIVGHGYDNKGGQGKYADPATTVWGSVNPHFWYDTSDFVSNFMGSNGITW